MGSGLLHYCSSLRVTCAVDVLVENLVEVRCTIRASCSSLALSGPVVAGETPRPGVVVRTDGQSRRHYGCEA